MRANAKLSIGIPTYNQGEYLKDTIRSLLNQTVRPFEIIVSNNFSCDNTFEVLKQFEGAVTIISPPSHLGMMEHWNFLVSKMKGEWFSLLSSDDVAKPNFVATLQRGIQRESNAVLIRSGWETIGADGKVKEKKYLLSVRNITSPPLTLYEQLLGPKLNFAAFAARKDAWVRVGGFPEECALNGDWGFWLKLSPFGDFVYEHEIISQYRVDYRPGLENIRLLRELRDELIIYTKIIPEAARTISDINWTAIAKATQLRFRKRISQASRCMAEHEREEAGDIFGDWNIIADCNEELTRFRAGDQLIYRDRFSSVKKIARYIYSWLR